MKNLSRARRYAAVFLAVCFTFFLLSCEYPGVEYFLPSLGMSGAQAVTEEEWDIEAADDSEDAFGFDDGSYPGQEISSGGLRYVKMKLEMSFAASDYPEIIKFYETQDDIADIDTIKLWCKIGEYDLNADGLSDYVAEFTDIIRSGSGGCMHEALISKPGGGFTRVSFATVGFSPAVMGTKTNGFYDIAFADNYYQVIWKYDGEESYSEAEFPPVYMTKLLADGTGNYFVKDGLLECVYHEARIDSAAYGDGFYIGLRAEALKGILERPVMFAVGEDGEPKLFERGYQGGELVFTAKLADGISARVEANSIGENGVFWPDEIFFTGLRPEAMRSAVP